MFINKKTIAEKSDNGNNKSNTDSYNNYNVSTTKINREILLIRL